jgi:hypothetical protein
MFQAPKSYVRNKVRQAPDFGNGPNQKKAKHFVQCTTNLIVLTWEHRMAICFEVFFRFFLISSKKFVCTKSHHYLHTSKTGPERVSF